MKKTFNLPRGTADILPEEAHRWQNLENTARKILARYGYQEIRTPIFEETELFTHSMGQTSDVVQKQMLTIKPQKAQDSNESTSFALRPEGTAAVVRSYIQNSLDKKENLSKLFYIGPMFRGERPQKGRLRQFNQIGVEAIGPESASPYLDAETIALSIDLLTAAGLKNSQLKINTIGTAEDKANFQTLLKRKLKPCLADLCEDCRDRFDRNVLRVLDCKNTSCKAVVKGLDITREWLSPESLRYFSTVKEALNALGIKYREAPDLVRGLDYYTQTVFEISDSSLGSQDALGAGGRYNNLVSELGGSAVDAVGFALGMERILLALEDETPAVSSVDLFIAALDETAIKLAFPILNELRRNGVAGEMGYRAASLKSQMRLANKLNARYVFILGEDEIKKGVVTIKNMATGDQKQESLTDPKKLAELLK